MKFTLVLCRVAEADTPRSVTPKRPCPTLIFVRVLPKRAMFGLGQTSPHAARFDLDHVPIFLTVFHFVMGRHIIFKCPQTGLNVQHWLAEEPDDPTIHKPVVCQACTKLHFVNIATGKLLGEREK